MGGGNCNPKDFGAAAYWDARYSSPSTGGKGGGGGFFDWYQSYSALRPLLRACVPASSRVLMLGCGNSLLSEDMVKDGYQNIANIDISSVVIEQMSEKHMDIPQLTYMQLDVRDMSFFGDGSFDCIIDKGTLDAMMCGDDAPHGAYKMLAEVARLMRPGGIYMLITYGAPKERLTLLNQVRCHWEVELYIMRKFEMPSLHSEERAQVPFLPYYSIIALFCVHDLLYYVGTMDSKLRGLLHSVGTMDAKLQSLLPLLPNSHKMLKTTNYNRDMNKGCY